MVLLVGDTNIEWPARVEENQLLEARLRRNFHCKNVKCLAFPSFNHGTVLVPGCAVVNNHILNALHHKEKAAAKKRLAQNQR